MMDEQSKFKEALASVTIRAEENGGKLSAEEAKELLKDMEFNDEQMSMIYAYLASKGYVVEGAVLPLPESGHNLPEVQRGLRPPWPVVLIFLL